MASRLNIQLFTEPCVIPPCPDCGAKPDYGVTVPTTVEHNPGCPLWAANRDVIGWDAFWFRRHAWAAFRISNIKPSELAELSWTNGPGAPDPGALMLVLRNGARKLYMPDQES